MLIFIMVFVLTEGAIESTSNLKRPPSEYEMTIKTLQWLKKVDSGCYDEPAEPAPPIAPAPAAPAPPKPKPANVSTLDDGCEMCISNNGINFHVTPG